MSENESTNVESNLVQVNNVIGEVIVSNVADTSTISSFSEEDNTKYNKKQYWDERFEKENEYEWLLSFKTVKDYLLRELSPENSILVVGCGNSALSADLYDVGFHNITSIDYSDVVIENMRRMHSVVRPEMQWQVMDMTQMSFEPNSFDVVLDKAAMDALLVEEGDVWDPEQEVVSAVDHMCQSVTKVMKTKFLQISFNQPHFRTKYLMGYRATGKTCSPYESQSGHSDRYNWDLSFEVINTGESGILEMFLYKMTR